jgi:hypothetical protein
VTLIATACSKPAHDTLQSSRNAWLRIVLPYDGGGDQHIQEDGQNLVGRRIEEEEGDQQEVVAVQQG